MTMMKAETKTKGWSSLDIGSTHSALDTCKPESFSSMFTLPVSAYKNLSLRSVCGKSMLLSSAHLQRHRSN